MVGKLATSRHHFKFNSTCTESRRLALVSPTRVALVAMSISTMVPSALIWTAIVPAIVTILIPPHWAATTRAVSPSVAVPVVPMAAP